MEFTLLWAALTGVVFAWIGTRLWPQGLPEHATDRLIGAAAAGLLVGRLTAMLIQGTNPLRHLGDIMIVRGGVHTGAATIGAIVTYLWSVGWRIAYLDAIAAASVLGLAGWKAGCIWRGACLGTVSDLPWAWSLPGSLITRHPVEIYAAIALVLAAFIVARLPDRPLLRSGVGLAAAGLVMLATEPMRPSLTGGPGPWYIAAIIVGVVASIAGSTLVSRFRLRMT